MTGPSSKVPCIFATSDFTRKINLSRGARTAPIWWENATSTRGSHRFTEFVANFKASDPNYQARCLECIQGNRCFPDEAHDGQPVFLLQNMFLDKAMSGYKGFFVESGANHWRKRSNSLFFEKCLGWDGLCIEPNPTLHADFKGNRSCKLVPEVITAEVGDYAFTFSSSRNSGKARITANKKYDTMVHGRPLDQMLAAVNRTHVDFWSLDIEGFEMIVLSSVPWAKVSFSTIVIEDIHLNMRELDMFMTMSGFMKVHQLVMDSVWVPRSATRTLSYPPGWHQFWSSVNDDLKRKRQCPKTHDKLSVELPA